MLLTALFRCLAASLVLVAAATARAGEGPPVAEPAAPDTAHGFWAPRFELADVSAWTLRGGELEVGPTAVRFGMFDVVHIGTRFALNLFGALNAEAKWTIHDDARIAVGVEAGLLRFDPELVGIDDDFALWAFPVSLHASGRPNDALRLHAAVQFLSARSGRQASDTVLRIQRYLGPVARLAAQVGFEWRFSDMFGLYAELETPIVLHRRTFRYEGEDDTVDFLRGSVAVQIVVSSLNIRLGGGYGPSFLGKSGPFPVLELTLRIY